MTHTALARLQRTNRIHRNARRILERADRAHGMVPSATWCLGEGDILGYPNFDGLWFLYLDGENWNEWPIDRHTARIILRGLIAEEEE